MIGLLSVVLITSINGGILPVINMVGSFFSQYWTRFCLTVRLSNEPAKKTRVERFSAGLPPMLRWGSSLTSTLVAGKAMSLPISNPNFTSDVHRPLIAVCIELFFVTACAQSWQPIRKWSAPSVLFQNGYLEETNRVKLLRCWIIIRLLWNPGGQYFFRKWTELKGM